MQLLRQLPPTVAVSYYPTQIRRLSSELAQFKSLYKDSSAQVEDVSDL